MNPKRIYFLCLNCTLSIYYCIIIIVVIIIIIIVVIIVVIIIVVVIIGSFLSARGGELFDFLTNSVRLSLKKTRY